MATYVTAKPRLPRGSKKWLPSIHYWVHMENALAQLSVTAFLLKMPILPALLPSTDRMGKKGYPQPMGIWAFEASVFSLLFQAACTGAWQSNGQNRVVRAPHQKSTVTWERRKLEWQSRQWPRVRGRVLNKQGDGFRKEVMNVSDYIYTQSEMAKMNWIATWGRKLPAPGNVMVKHMPGNHLMETLNREFRHQKCG